MPPKIGQNKKEEKQPKVLKSESEKTPVKDNVKEAVKQPSTKEQNKTQVKADIGKGKQSETSPSVKKGVEAEKIQNNAKVTNDPKDSKSKDKNVDKKNVKAIDKADPVKVQEKKEDKIDPKAIKSEVKGEKEKKQNKSPEKKETKQKNLPAPGKNDKSEVSADTVDKGVDKKKEEKKKEEKPEIKKDPKAKEQTTKKVEKQVNKSMKQPQKESRAKANDKIVKQELNKKQQKAVPKVKSGQDLIKQTGLLEAYEQFLRAICKHGLPTGDVYQFAAQQIEKYERKKRAKQLKLKAQLEIQRAAKRRGELAAEEHSQQRDN